MKTYLSLFPVTPTSEHRASVTRIFHFCFLILRQSLGPIGRGISPSQGRYPYKDRINTHKQPCLELVFEPTIPEFERAKTIRGHEGVWRTGYIDLHFLDFGTSWRGVVSFTYRSLYHRGRCSRTAGLEDMEKRKFLTLPGLELGLLGRPGRSQPLYRLRYTVICE
jgi:hypothetical protein